LKKKCYRVVQETNFADFYTDSEYLLQPLFH